MEKEEYLKELTYLDAENQAIEEVEWKEWMEYERQQRLPAKITINIKKEILLKNENLQEK